MHEVKSSKHFNKKIKELSKNNHLILDDIRSLFEALQNNPKKGKSLGNRLYKIRLANSSKNKGKSGGYRVITYLVDKNKLVYLLEIYDKAFKQNVSKKELAKILKDTGLDNLS